MIEFKAECGHTIRAKDEDEGKVVRCSYCGREAQVPQNDADDLDFMFADLESAGSKATTSPSRKTRRAMKRRPKVMRSEEGEGGFNPFAVTLKMIYAALIIIVIIVAVRAGMNNLPSVRRWLSERPAERKEEQKLRRLPARKNKRPTSAVKGSKWTAITRRSTSPLFRLMRSCECYPPRRLRGTARIAPGRSPWTAAWNCTRWAPRA